MTETTEFSFMLNVSTLPGAGVGVFALHDIAAGTKLALLPENSQKRLMHESEIPEVFIKYCLAKENDMWEAPAAFNAMEIFWYLNHSATPNVAYKADGLYALSDLKKGDELFFDYNDLGEPEEKKKDYYKKK